MSLCEKYNKVSETTCFALNKIETVSMKKLYLNNVQRRIKILDKRYSLEEKLLNRFDNDLIINHLSCVHTCQDVAHIMIEQLTKQIKEMES